MKKPVNIGAFQIRDRRLEQFLFYHDIFFVDSHQCEDGSMIWEYEDCPYFREVEGDLGSPQAAQNQWRIYHSASQKEALRREYFEHGYYSQAFL